MNAARLNSSLRVIILEKSNKLLSKVKVSGGGRCNVTHDCDQISEMSKNYPRGGKFVKKVFGQFFVKDTVDWFARRSVKLKTEPDGRMFPVSNSSQTIVDCLLREAETYRVEIKLQNDVSAVKKQGDKFVIQTSVSHYYADCLCIATGGFPKASMFEWIAATGHSFEKPVPSLFTFNLPGNPVIKLMGVSVEHASIKIPGTKLQQQGALLITHWGLSGPCVLRLSARAARELAQMNWDFGIVINWVPLYNEKTLSEKIRQVRFEIASQKVMHKNPFCLPARLWEFLVADAGISPETRWADLPAKFQNLLIKKLCAYECAVKGKTTFKEEFVTAGGINLSEIDPHTMMSKVVPGLYFAGEIIDVDGITGGYNFQNAWSTGYVAAKSVAEQLISNSF